MKQNLLKSDEIFETIIAGKAYVEEVQVWFDCYYLNTYMIIDVFDAKVHRNQQFINNWI